MGAKTEISWTDSTWSPLRARVKSDAAAIATAKGYTSLIQIAGKMAGHVGPHCEPVSHGCDKCYSGTNNNRCLPANGTGLPFDRRSRDLVEPFVDEKILVQPLRWRKPVKVFVENQSDLFGEWVTDEQIDRVFAVMAVCPQHTFQVLTKRPERMLAYLTRLKSIRNCGHDENWAQLYATFEDFTDETRFLYRKPFPLPNVWLGVSCEDQKTADARIPLLLQTPAAVRFVSYEPALGPVDFAWQLFSGVGSGRLNLLHWVIVGGEAGPGARPFDVSWARETIGQCKAAGVACFVKQLGALPVLPDCGPVYQCNGSDWPEGTRFSNRTGDKQFNGRQIILEDRKGGDMPKWAEDLRVREFPAVPQ